MRARSWIALTTLSLAACGGGQTRGSAFDPSWFNDDGAAVSELQKTFKSPVPLGADVAIPTSVLLPLTPIATSAPRGTGLLNVF